MSQIYVIFNNVTDNIYIGSTNCYLSTRLSQHKYYWKQVREGNPILRYSSEKIFEDDKGNPCEAKIGLLDIVDKDEQYLKENYYIQYFKDLGFNVVNINNACLTPEILKEKRKIRYDGDPEKYRLQAKMYYYRNREKVKKKNKEYYHKNKVLKSEIKTL